MEQEKNYIINAYSAFINGVETGFSGCSNVSCNRHCLRKSDKLKIVDLYAPDRMNQCQVFIPGDSICLVCKDDYGDIAEECFTCGVCPDCKDSYSLDELVTLAVEAL